MDIFKRLGDIIDQIQLLRSTCYPNENLPIEYLTIFSQSDDDFFNLRNSLLEIGIEKEANNGFKYELKIPMIYNDEKITLVRVRKPDIHRKELGCADLKYSYESYDRLRENAFERGFDIILRKGYEMIELSNFNINAYAYLVKDL